MRIQSLLLGICFFAGAAFAVAGEYQQTRDGKTTVWNVSPKSGETASWSGSRDKEGYATGFGTITWYTGQGTVYSEYYGNMVNGKLEGPVNMHEGRRTAHAYFADGGRVTAWARGRAPSQMNVPEELVAKRRKAEAETPKPKEQRAEAKKPTPEKPATEPVRPVQPAPKPVVAETTPQPTPQQRENIEPPALETPPPASTATRPPIAETTATIPTPEPTQSTSSLMEPPRIAESQESSSAIAQETPPASTPEPAVEQKPEAAEQSSTPEAAKKSSLTDLTGPPSSLRENSSEAPKSETSPTARRSGTRGVASLTEDEAIGVADAEARAKGYDLAQYQRPKADFSAVKDKWSLFYTLKDPKGAGGDLQPFSVTVEDKTRKVEIRRNY